MDGDVEQKPSEKNGLPFSLSVRLSVRPSVREMKIVLLE